MRWIRGAVVVAAFAAAGGPTTRDATAGKPGGATLTPPGTIYFRDQASAGPYPYFTLGSMDGGGGSRAVVGQTHLDVRASRRLHGGNRWLLTLEDVVGEPGVGGAVRREVFAVREDGALHVRLTGEEVMEYWRVEWAPDEDAGGATVSMFGRQWTGTASSDTVVAGTVGLYTARLSFDGAGDVVGLDAAPAFAVSLGTSARYPTFPDAFSYSWSPDMTRIAADDQRREQIRVVDVASGVALPLGPGGTPDWSPDGSRIAFTRLVPASGKGTKETVALQTMRPDGTGVTTLRSVNHWVPGWEQWMSGPKWSPDGAYLAYTFVKDSNYVHRIAANGAGNTNLTPDATPGGSGYGFVLVDWR
jgi:hypothetical protein